MDRYEGFREFVAARGMALMGTAYLLTGDRHQAQDLLQSVWVKLATRWQRIDAGGNPEAYARTTLYREFLSWRRVRRNREVPQAQLPESAVAEDLADATVRRVLLQQALQRLTARQRAVIVLRFYEDRSEADTARLLGCTVGTVKSQTHHALRRLQESAPELGDLFTRAAPETIRGAR